MARDENSFTDNMSSVARIYGTHAGIDTDENGRAAHIDGEGGATSQGTPPAGSGNMVDSDDSGEKHAEQPEKKPAAKKTAAKGKG